MFYRYIFCSLSRKWRLTLQYLAGLASTYWLNWMMQHFINNSRWRHFADLPFSVFDGYGRWGTLELCRGGRKIGVKLTEEGVLFMRTVTLLWFKFWEFRSSHPFCTSASAFARPASEKCFFLSYFVFSIVFSAKRSGYSERRNRRNNSLQARSSCPARSTHLYCPYKSKVSECRGEDYETRVVD